MSRIAPQTLVTAWRLLRETAVDVFKPGVARTLRDSVAWSGLGMPVEGIETDVRVTILDALRAVSLVSDESGRRNADEIALVATAPRRQVPFLSTSDVVTTILAEAKRSLLVIGFQISDETFLSALCAKGLAGIQVTVVGDRLCGGARELLRRWPATARPLIAFENVETPEPTQPKLHGKVLIADDRLALIGSANFTGGGLRRNFELSVRVTGPTVSAIPLLIDRLYRDGWLVPAVP